MDRRVMLTLALSLGLTAGCQTLASGPSGHPTFSLGLQKLEGPPALGDIPLGEVPAMPGLLPGEIPVESKATVPVKGSGGGGSSGGFSQVPSVHTPAGTGELTVDLRPFLQQFQPAAQRRILATVADIEYVTITVEVPGFPAVTQTVLKTGLTSGSGSATFSGLQPGMATVTIKAFNVTNGSIGGATQTAAIASGVNTIINFVIQLDPTYVPGAGDVITDVTFIDGPIVIGTPPPTPAASGTVIGTYPVGDKPEAIAFDKSGNPWVANFGAGSVTKLGPAGGAFGTYKPGPMKPTAIAVDASDNVYVADYGQAGALYKLKAADGTLITKLTGVPYMTGLAINKLGVMWATGYLTKSVTRFTLTGVPPVPPGSPIGNTTVGEYPIAIATDSLNTAWVVNFKTNTVSRVDPTGKVMSTITLEAASEPEGIAIDPTSGNVWVTHNQTHKVTKIGPTGAVVGQFAVGQRPRGVAIDKAGYVWVVNSDSDTVTKLGQDGTVQKTVNVGDQPRAIGVDPSGFIWVTNSGDDTVTKIAP